MICYDLIKNMAKKKQKKENKKKKGVKVKLINKKVSVADRLHLKEETIKAIYGFILLFFSIFLMGAAWGYAGKIGSFIFDNLNIFLGIGYYLVPLIFFILSILFFKNIQKPFRKVQIFGSFLFILSGLNFLDLVFENGGYLGSILSSGQEYLGYPMAIIFALILFVISLIIIFDGIPKIKLSKTRYVEIEEDIDEKKLSKKEKQKIEKTANKEEQKDNNKNLEQAENERKKKFALTKPEKKKSKNDVDVMEQKLKSFLGADLPLPPLKLLNKTFGKIDSGNVEEKAEIIKKTLSSFGIRVEIEGAEVGPTITRFTLRPASGVRVSKISALSDDLALALAAKSVLVEAPIPGKALVGIEIPNDSRATVGAYEIIGSPEFQNSKYILPMALGKDVAGNVMVASLEKSPHLLISGTTGSGKSVTLHTIIISLLYKHGPDSLKFILVDPKMVELPVYNNIPHLLTPVITDAKKTILALRWAVKEMDRRLEVMSEDGVRNIADYHKKVVKAYKGDKENAPEPIPYIVFVIDELSDIMQQFPKELEAGIVSIAQKARAAGIHLILSTQRPSVDVVTGLIKANIPTRIALRVSSSTDSKTIIGKGGAEKLLGQGDMLLMAEGMNKATRLQSVFISDAEVKAIVKFLKKAYKTLLNEDISLQPENEVIIKKEQEVVAMPSQEIDFNEDDFDLDSLFQQAVDEVIATGKASTSYLQRRLSIGYSRAAKIIDQLEEKGIVGPANGSKPRNVLIGEEE